MDKVGLLKNACITFVVCMATAIDSPAQTFTTLDSFDGSNGENPYAGLIQGTDGNLYGTAENGVAGAGTVFRMTPEGTLTTLHLFCTQGGCPDGAYPYAGLVQATDGNFYGTTSQGGANDNGTVFRITPTGELITLYSFCAQAGCTDGSSPSYGLVQATDGNFYGTTFYGGANGYGTLFQITPAGTLTTLYTFCSQTGCTDGAYPQSRLTQAADGNLYGTTGDGGTHPDTCPSVYGCGTVFKITLGGMLTTIYSFCPRTGCRDGAYPLGGLVQATDGNFYGTSWQGGTASTYCDPIGCGTVFRITPGGWLTTMHSFCTQAACSDGSLPYGELIQATDGNFYGTTRASGAYSNGTVFRITPSGKLTTLHAFCAQAGCSDGSFVYAGLVQANDSNFYGTTVSGGAYGYGTVFRLAVAPAATLSPTSLTFVNQALDETSVAKTVTLKNSGTYMMTISSVATGGNFAISANTCGTELAMGSTCKVGVTFTPTVLGKVNGTLTFADNAANSPQIVPLSGTGVEPATLTPAGAIYMPQTVGTTSAAKTFTLTNNQTLTLTSVAISTTGDFAVSATTCTTSLVAKGKCTISVTFTPTATGTRKGTLSVSDSASNSPQTSGLKGTGT